MCRLTGFWDFRSDNRSTEQVLTKMRDVLAHGGPDYGGNYYDKEIGLGFGHRRLSIIDLSAAGNQPFIWKNWICIFNGEIYNYKEIQADLINLGYEFESGSDTEVLVKAFDCWADKAVDRFRGMFAFGLWDTETQTLSLYRDRVGVKPLFYYWKDDLLMFASELKSFHEHPDFDKTIDKKAVSQFLQKGYISAPLSIFKNVRKLPAGSFLTFSKDKKHSITKYWDPNKVYQKPRVNKSEKETEEELEAILKESFQLRMVADVPVGVFLSGGIDSSIVTGMLAKNTGQKLRTFTIGFEEKEYNEATFAKEIADYLGTDHTEYICTEKEFKEIIPNLPEIYDEPFGDSSGIPTCLLSNITRESVKVSLSADGGDELFGGYTKYEITKNQYPKLEKIPLGLRKFSSKLLKKVDPYWIESNLKIGPLKNYSNLSNKLPKFLDSMTAGSTEKFFHSASNYISSEALTKLYPNFQNGNHFDVQIEEDRLIGYLGLIDIHTYLEGDIMTKVDRATMQTALEGREPMLDHHVIEYALGLPDDLKIRGNTTKYILRNILFKYVPRELIERPKQGFSVPIKSWLLNFLQTDLDALKNDNLFFEAFELDQKATKNLISDFTNQRKYVNPHFVWFLYTLHRWFLRWIK